MAVKSAAAAAKEPKSLISSIYFANLYFPARHDPPSRFSRRGDEKDLGLGLIPDTYAGGSEEEVVNVVDQILGRGLHLGHGARGANFFRGQRQ